MNAFLSSAKKVYETLLMNPCYYESLTVVLGNESCDLDSAISALVYAFFLHHEGIQDHLSKTAVLPLFNIDHDDFQLKTEVVHFLRASDISMDFVPTRGSRDLLDLEKIHKAGRLKLVLVDHHTLPPADLDLSSAVVQVIDHRPRDPDWPWDHVKEVTIEPVGSCASLVAKKMIDQSSYLLTPEIVKLLLGPIVVDTVNLSPEAGRATPLDCEVVGSLEKTIAVDRKQLFEELIEAKSNVSALSVSQILRKDLKIVAGVPIAGAPLLLDDLSRREDFASAVTSFMKLKGDVPAMVLMGVRIQGDSLQRDVAVSWRDSDAAERLVQALLDSSSPSLQLEEVTDRGFEQMRLFRQGNIKATRKHIAPLILKVASEVPDNVSNGV